MAYVTPIHQPSAVRNAVKLSMLVKEERLNLLAVSRSNRLELYTVNHNEPEQVVQLISSTYIHGQVTTLNKYRPPSQDTDLLFVGTDLQTYFTMEFKENQLQTVGIPIDLSENNAEAVEFERATIDPSKQVMVVEAYEGILKTITLQKRQRSTGGRHDMSESSNTMSMSTSRIPEFTVRASAFIHRPSQKSTLPRMAFLWEDHEGRSFLKVRQAKATNRDYDLEFVDLDSADEKLYELITVDYGACQLIPINQEPYGLLILGETSISYFDDSSFTTKQRTALESPSIWMCWTRIDTQRYLLADNYGKLYQLGLYLNPSTFAITGWQLDLLGITSQAHCLVYLDMAMVFIGSHEGDSQVVRITQKSHELIQVLPSLGPILDFTVMDLGNRAENDAGNEFSTGQARIVCGSGTWSDGSLRSVRSGVSLQDLGIIEDLDLVTHLFPIKLDQSSSRTYDSIMVSFIDETRLFHFDQDYSLTEIDMAGTLGFVQDRQTLYASNVENSIIVQITIDSMQLHEIQDMHSKSIKSASKFVNEYVTTVSAKGHRLAIALDGAIIQLVDMAKGFQLIKRAKQQEQISCLYLHSRACLVGSWNRALIHVLEIDTLVPLLQIPINSLGNVIVQSILVSKMSLQTGHETLLASMADGHVVTFDLDPLNFSVRHESATILGTKQADLYDLPSKDRNSSVFVSSEHPTLIYLEDTHLNYSAINYARVTAVCSFDASNFQLDQQTRNQSTCIAVASAGNIVFAEIDNERTTQVQPLRIDQTVRRIAYSAKLKLFGVGVLGRSIQDNEEVAQSSFQILDEVLFKECARYDLRRNEVVESLMCIKSNNKDSSSSDKFMVGTAFVSKQEASDYGGRIIVLEVIEDEKLKVVTQLAAKQPVRCFAQMNDLIVIGVENNIGIYTLDSSTSSKASLKRLTNYPVRTAVIDLVTQGQDIIYADVMKSITVLSYQDKNRRDTTAHKLVEVAHHRETTWSTAVSAVDKKSYLLSDAIGNLQLLQQNDTAISEVDRQSLMSIGEFRLGEVVNRISPINIISTKDSLVQPKAFLATVEGSLYMFGLINKTKVNLLLTLQRNMASRVKGAGGISHDRYRAFRNDIRVEDEPKRFVDGEFLEKFLTCDREVQQACVRQLVDGDRQVTVEDMCSMVETLKRMR